MQGIGITNWQNINNTEYPLVNAGGLNGVFCDASFISYDNFVPTLNTITITETELILNILMDDGAYDFAYALSTLSEGVSVRLRTINRSYGCLVFGQLISDIIAKKYSNIITLNAAFNNNTVRTITSTNGVYSINGLLGNVSIAFDNNLIYNTSSYFGYPTISAASLPTNLQTLELSANQAYLFNSSQELILANTVNNTLSPQTTLDKVYDIIYDESSHLIGVLNEYNKATIYVLSSIPATPLLTNITGNITGITTDNASNLWVLINNSLYNYGHYPYTVNNTGIDTGITNTLGLTYLNSTFYTFTNGPQDYSTLPSIVYFSSFIYTVTVSGLTATSTLLGPLVDPTINNSIHYTANQHVPWLGGIFIYNNALYGWNMYSTSFNIYNINTNTLYITPYFQSTYNLSNNINTVFIGGPTITLNSIIPLKTINGVSPYNNQITITGDAVMSIAQTTGNTLTLNIPIKDSNLNVARSVVYE